MSQNPILKAGSASDVINKNKGRVEYGNILGQQMAVEAGILPSVTLQKGGGGSAASRVASILGSSVVTAAERTTAVTNLISNVSINATTAIRLSAAARGSYGITNVPGAVTIRIPGAPTGLVATPSNQTLSIAFSLDTGNSPITNYSYSTNGTTYTEFSPAQTGSTVSITGLTNGTPYTFYLKAINAIGTGPASAALTAAPAIEPTAPTIGTPTAGNGSVSLTFTAPGNNGGSAITNYSYSTDGTNYIALSPAQTTSPLTISGLTNGVSYTVRIRAINAAGSSVASSASSSFTPAPPPPFTVTSGTASTSIANGRTYYRFTTNGSITLAGAAATVEIFAVGGGGAGGRGTGNTNDYGGGGGAGGLQTNSSTNATGSQLVSIPALTAAAVYTIVVGTGGIRSEGIDSAGAGSNTTFSGTGISVTAFGGGPGKGRWSDGSAPAGTRGCGGGGRGTGENNGLATQGFNGNSSVLNGGGGGIGGTTANLIGGAGLTYPSGGITYGVGGTGSSNQSSGADGTANTGNGGGGGGQQNEPARAGNGGSGVFIISHAN